MKKRFLDKMLGVKLFKQDSEKNIHMIRIIDMNKATDNVEYTIKDYDDNSTRKVLKDELKDYIPLEPNAILTASIVTIPNDYDVKIKDVIVTGSTYLDARLGMSPYCVCRQNISDIFAEMFCASEENEVVGLSINKDTCPPEFDMNIMMAADEIIFHQLVNFYRTDTLDDILDMLDVYRFDEVLSELYNIHCKTNNPMAMVKNSDGGWCKTFKELLKTNNFQTDINQMLGITEVGFEMEPYFEERILPGKDIRYNVLRDDIKAWLSCTYKININEASVIEFDHDIDLADFKDTYYFLFRDSTKKMYLVVYTKVNEFFKADLEALSQQYDFSTKFKLDFYNKYN